MPMVGGIGDVKEPNEEVISICEKIKGEVESKMNKTFQEFKPKKYKTQVVAGLNFFIKIHVGDGEYIHVRVYRALDQSLSFHSHQEGKTEVEEITYF